MKRATSAEAPDRLVEVAGILRRYHLEGCAARAAGNDGEVLLLSPDRAAAEAALASTPLLEELRATGFRYVALDLAPPDAEDEG